jgi:5-methylcytosine-specific restriction protein B
MIQLQGDRESFHLRTYLEKPSANVARADIGQLPERLRRLILDTGGDGAVMYGDALEPDLPKLRAKELMKQVIRALREGPNVLLAGAPGTGKTVVLEDLEAYFRLDEPLFFDPEIPYDNWWDVPPLASAYDRRTRSLVFHPSYTYEEFVAGLVPSVEKKSSAMKLVATPGALTNMAHFASEPEHAGLLVLDEFNRGNAAAIFGDTLSLLDGDKRADPTAGGSGAAIDRPFPDYAMTVPADFVPASGTADVPPQLRLPRDLYVAAAMNTADRSVAPVDAALRRRFNIIRTPPDYSALAEHFGISLPAGPWNPHSNPDAWTIEEIRELAIRLLRGLNERVEAILGEDFLLGHALAWPVLREEVEPTREALCRALDERIVATLRLTLIDRDDALAAILAIGGPDVEVSKELSPIAAWEQPTELLADAGAIPRLRLRPILELPWPEAGSALAAIAVTQT